MLAPFFATLGYVIHPILKSFGFGFQVLILALPIVATTREEPSLDPIGRRIPHRAVVMTVHGELHFQVSGEHLPSASATRKAKTSKPKTAKLSTIFISPD